jgi:hypothetical protein
VKNYSGGLPKVVVNNIADLFAGAAARARDKILELESLARLDVAQFQSSQEGVPADIRIIEKRLLPCYLSNGPSQFGKEAISVEASLILGQCMVRNFRRRRECCL